MPVDEQRRVRPGVQRRLLERRLAAGVHPHLARRVAERLTTRALDGDVPPKAWLLHRDAAVGSAWTHARDGRAYLVDLDVPLADAPDALAALAGVLGPDGVRQVVVDVVTGEAVLTAAVSSAEAILQATQMQLDLGATVAAPRRVVLQPMSEVEFATYRAQLVATYAQDLLDAGAFSDLGSALESSARQTDDLLPEGLRSPGHHLWTATDGAIPVGLLWIHADGPAAFIYDIEVAPEQRRRGYGREILDAGARAAVDLGAEVLGLNVFGHNDGARAMYEKAGYATTEQTFRIALPPR
jgi:ribosomal protein S18 acetylase RimI-like enzyme